MKTRQTQMKPSRRRAAFTLLEVLLVLIILGVIAAMVVPNLLGTQERANINATQASIHGLEETLKLYAGEHNARYPEDLEQLLQPTDLQDQPMKPYLDEFPKDAWGQPLNYELTTDSGAAATTKPRIWSNGPNEENEDGSGDDINNWSNKETR